MKELSKDYISALIEQRGMTKTEFAEKMGYAKRQYLDAVLNNKKKDIATVAKMAEVLGIPLLEFIGVKEVDTHKVYGCIYVDNKPHLVGSKKDIEDLMNKI